MSDRPSLAASRHLWERAARAMPGGVNASARYNRALGHALFVTHGQGAYLYDVDGTRYLDYCMSHGASLLGHGHPAIVAAVQRALELGILCSCETEHQVALAERLKQLFPGTDMVRYTCSGTEDTWHAVRVARAYTGRLGVIKFEGHYHGVNDTVGYSHWPKLAQAGPADQPRSVPDSAGIPPHDDALITILPFNDVAALERTLRAQGDQIAAVIMEPVNYDSCGLVPTDAFLQAVRTLTRELGIVLIFDEILSGFRCGPGSAVAGRDVQPDMTCLGKAIGGGMPLSIFMGRRDIMETCTPIGPALHSGTYNAHLTLILAAQAFLDVVTADGFYEHLDALGERLYAGIREIMARRGIACWVQGVGARFGLLFGVEQEPRNYRDVARQNLALADKFHLACLERGVFLAQGSPHHGYSAAHTLQDIDHTLDVMDQAAAVL